MTRLALCGGIYSNPYALCAFLDDARARGADRLVCLGDFGAYGAEPEAVHPLLRENGVECLAGNYEVAIGSGQTDCGCGYTDDADNAFAQIAYDYTFQNTSAEFAAWTVTTDGWHWHPAGADLGTSPDMYLGGPEVTMGEAKRRVLERFLRFRQRDGSLPLIYQCAV